MGGGGEQEKSSLFPVNFLDRKDAFPIYTHYIREVFVNSICTMRREIMKKRLVIGITLLVGLAIPAMAMAAIDCMSCHGSTGAKYSLAGTKLGYEVSGHATAGNSRYANAEGCQRCHTNEG
jgi:hypothetical protein